MMSDTRLLLQTALAPATWGTTYAVMSEVLPPDRPLLAAVGRALPAGILLALIFRGLPTGSWWWRAPLLGSLNVGIFFALLVVAADRLPGGVAATLGAIGPLLVAILAWLLLGSRPGARAVLAGLAGVGGVALLVLTPAASLDPIGVAAGLGATFCASLGLVLTRRFGPPPASLLVATGWQLVAAGALLVPVTLLFEGTPPVPTGPQALGFAYLATFATAVAYALWFRGIGGLAPQRVAFLVLLSPVVATAVGWIVLGQSLGALQIVGTAVALVCLVAAQGGASRAPSPPVGEDAGASPTVAHRRNPCSSARSAGPASASQPSPSAV
jgi:probable blue pigment (indigoidine) exporter